MRTLLAVLATLVWISAARAEEGVIDATDLAALRAKAGTNVVVEGQVSEIGTTKDGGITFINIGMARKQGFVAVIFRDSYQAFPDGFDKFREKKVRVSGALTLFRGETPQIKLNSPDQIQIVTQ
jgi:DNA/RNA endonuclease YhcR with UshA esterase domain